MGAWGHGSFENDDAADFIADLVEMNDPSLIDEALQRVLDARADYVVAPDASCALAAAEVVAALNGSAAQDLPDELREWIEGKDRPTPEQVARAREVVAQVRSDSELRDLVEEAESLGDWEPLVADLQRRLA